MATSGMAHGDIQIAARENRSLPEGFGVDNKGQATTDPHAVLNGGALLPFGGTHGSHKGSALSMMVELLAAALTGGHFSWEFDWSEHPGAQSPWTGELILAIDPSKNPAGQAGHGFAERCEILVQSMLGAGQPRLPGQQRYRQRALSLTHGVPLACETWHELQALAGHPV